VLLTLCALVCTVAAGYAAGWVLYLAALDASARARGADGLFTSLYVGMPAESVAQIATAVKAYVSCLAFSLVLLLTTGWAGTRVAFEDVALALTHWLAVLAFTGALLAGH
jgi:hypothetical protein